MSGLIYRFRFIVTIASMIVVAATYGQVRKPQVTIAINGNEVSEQSLGFSLDRERGSRRIIPLKPAREGTFTVKVEWEGGAKSLALILNGPGQTGYYARKDGPSPLYLQYKFTPQQVSSAGEWQLSIVNFEAGTSALGSVALYWPVATVPSVAPGDTMFLRYNEFLARDRSKWGEGQRQILPDGGYRIDYPTGFYIISIRNGDIVFYDAGEKRIYKVFKLRPYIGAVKADAPTPSLPGASSTWASTMNKWIDHINQILLDEIKELLENDLDLLKQFEDLEKGKTIYQMLMLRLDFIERLRKLKEGC